MRYCHRCDRYVQGCRHLDRRKEPRGPFPRVTAFLNSSLDAHGRSLAFLLVLGTLAYVVGGVWGLW